MNPARKLLELHVFGRTRFQPVFALLHRVALAGMNFGPPEPTGSGETWVLDQLARRYAAREAIVLDVGANVGDYAEQVLARLPGVRLHCFEPSATAFAALRDRLGADRRVTLHPYALGAVEGEATLYADRPGSGLGSIYRRRLEHFGIDVSASERIVVRTLDAVRSEQGLARIDLLKLDVEGAELTVLEGASAALEEHAIAAIQFEFGGANIDSRSYFQDFFYRLSPDYRIHRLLRDGLLPIRQYREEDETFVTSNYLCLSRHASEFHRLDA